MSQSMSRSSCPGWVLDSIRDSVWASTLELPENSAPDHCWTGVDTDTGIDARVHAVDAPVHGPEPARRPGPGQDPGGDGQHGGRFVHAAGEEHAFSNAARTLHIVVPITEEASVASS